ncbi:diaminopimelate epimerase [Amniculibacterium aquaticum]|uniref:diaminopimelate epimerase n=1 Tax=Amniculibacterium aquaticum TaxID=2479858 RepID=UPI000F59C4D9|nr:diaminopimelate epimerase [Amniculibacterium aquaticum]
MENTTKFYKFQGTGNDFIMIDNRDLIFPKNTETIARLCDRRFGIGGDGLILLENEKGYDFKMVYYNSDGNESTMCGNGGRCLVAFAYMLDIFEEQCHFIAIDGPHDASIDNGLVQLKMIDVDTVEDFEGNTVLNTGSPHFVQRVENLKDYEVFAKGKAIRNSEKFLKEGINVNFVEVLAENQLFVRTYERGVEDETYSCGTGVTASAISYLRNKNMNEVKVKVLGGNLKVRLEKDGDSFKNIWLEGPAKLVFEGKVNL